MPQHGTLEESIRRGSLTKAQDTVRDIAIYQRNVRGRAATYILEFNKTTWCNASSYDAREATGVNMEPFYGAKGCESPKSFYTI